MTIAQLFHALLLALTSQPESNRVDRLLASLAARTGAQLHDSFASSLRLACLQIRNPEPVMAADRLLRHYGFALTATRHRADAHLISIKRHPTSTDLDSRVRVTPISKGAQAS